MGYNGFITDFKEVITVKKLRPVLMIAGALALTLAAGIAAMGIIYQTTSENYESCYSRIDNSCVEAIAPHGGMNYRYTLQVYSQEGDRKELKLDTSRVLKDGAYILIKTAPLRGVIGWEGLTYDQLPAAVQKHYPE